MVISLPAVALASEAEMLLLSSENKVTNYLGKISYGIYIFHPIVIYVCSTICRENELFIGQGKWASYVAMLMVVMGTVAISAGVDWIVTKYSKK